MTVINVTRRPHQIRQDNAPDDDRENNQSSAIAVNDNMDMRQQNLRQIRCRGYGKLLPLRSNGITRFYFS